MYRGRSAKIVNKLIAPQKAINLNVSVIYIIVNNLEGNEQVSYKRRDRLNNDDISTHNSLIQREGIDF